MDCINSFLCPEVCDMAAAFPVEALAVPAMPPDIADVDQILTEPLEKAPRITKIVQS